MPKEQCRVDLTGTTSGSKQGYKDEGDDEEILSARLKRRSRSNVIADDDDDDEDSDCTQPPEDVDGEGNCRTCRE